MVAGLRRSRGDGSVPRGNVVSRVCCAMVSKQSMAWLRADEEGTLSALNSLRKDIIDPKVAEHHGRIVKLMGVPVTRAATNPRRILILHLPVDPNETRPSGTPLPRTLARSCRYLWNRMCVISEPPALADDDCLAYDFFCFLSPDCDRLPPARTRRRTLGFLSIY